MRIQIDPVSDPPHALSRAQVKAILARVPTEWLFGIQVVHLGATLPEHCRFPLLANYSAYSDRLNLYCRGLEPAEAERELLRALALRGGGGRTRDGGRLSHEELQKLDTVVSSRLRLGSPGYPMGAASGLPARLGSPPSGKRRVISPLPAAGGG